MPILLHKLSARKRIMRRSICSHHGEKGLTLIEILIALAILGILAAIIVANTAVFSSTGRIAAANTEVANVETAAMAYYANNKIWPSDTNTDLANSGYLNGTAVYDYSFDSFGRVVVPDETTWPNDGTISWSTANHKWQH